MIIKKNQINSAIKNLTEGNIIIYPTDTLYGLGADATNTFAVEIKRYITMHCTILATMKCLINNSDLILFVNFFFNSRKL